MLGGVEMALQQMSGLDQLIRFHEARTGVSILLLFLKYSQVRAAVDGSDYWPEAELTKEVASSRSGAERLILYNRMPMLCL
jgi:hypothetical protein